MSTKISDTALKQLHLRGTPFALNSATYQMRSSIKCPKLTCKPHISVCHLPCQYRGWWFCFAGEMLRISAVKSLLRRSAPCAETSVWRRQQHEGFPYLTVWITHLFGFLVCWWTGVVDIRIVGTCVLVIIHLRDFGHCVQGAERHYPATTMVGDGKDVRAALGSEVSSSTSWIQVISLASRRIPWARTAICSKLSGILRTRSPRLKKCSLGSLHYFAKRRLAQFLTTRVCCRYFWRRIVSV